MVKICTNASKLKENAKSGLLAKIAAKIVLFVVMSISITNVVNSPGFKPPTKVLVPTPTIVSGVNAGHVGIIKSSSAVKELYA